MNRPSAQTLAAWGIALTGLITLSVLSVTAGPLATSARVDLGQVDAALLDTLDFANRSYTAALAGTVSVVDDDGTAWVERRGIAFPVVSSDSTAFEPMSSVLVVGRLRGTNRGRWLEASEWTHVRGIPDVQEVRSRSAVQKGE